MLQQAATPSFWKALVFTTIFGLPIAYSMSLAFNKVAPIVWYVATPLVIAVTAYGVHTRMLDDWRANDRMHMEKFNRTTSVKRNIRVKRK
jgi:hypothetical protein